MAVKLRLTRMGRKKRPFYRIVAIDSRKRRDGAYLEKLGHYDPLTRPATLVIDHDAAVKWLNTGAIPSDTVKNLFRRDGVMLRWDMSKRNYDQVKIEEAVKAHRERRDALALSKEAPEPVKQQAKVKPEPEAPKQEAKVEEAPKQEAKAEEAPAEAPVEEAKTEAPAEEPKAAAPEADTADEAAEAKEAAPAEEPDTKEDSKKE